MEMETQTFISKYKPRCLHDFDTDKRLVSILNTLLEIDDLNMMFIGNPSSGKTTLLYAMLREYYGLKDNENIPETNVMNINNLKEQGVNFFRNEMKTFCQSHCSVYGKKKVIMIDDIDLVNEQSQQVFRNYIDKYKNNIHFMCSCTNVQKVIESLQSRLHIINILSPTMEKVNEIMKHIVKNEDMNMDTASQTYLLNKSNGSIRNLINNLEKIWVYVLNDPSQLITQYVCEKLCSTISFYQFEEYICALKTGDLKTAIQILFEINDYGYSVIDILDYFYTFVKSTNRLTEDEKYQIIPFLCKYITIFNNTHEHCIELAMFSNNLCNMIRNI
jgi:DNA polymerase III delta prime subunit